MNDLWKKIQPLRVANGWTIDLNNLYDIELTQENIGWFCGEFLLSGSNHSKKICFDASFEPEGDINGGFVVKFFSMYYDKKLNNFELNKFLGTFETKDRHQQTRASPPVPPVFQRRRQTAGRLGFRAPLLGRPAPRIAIRRARIPEKNAAAPDPAGHPAFANADYRKIMVGQRRRTRPHCRRHCPAPPRSQHRPIGMEYGRQHLAAPRRHRPPTAPQTAHRHRAAGKNHLQQSGAKRIFHQQSHRLGIARLQQNQPRMGTRLYQPTPAQNGQTELARSGEIFAAKGRLKT